MQVCRYASVYAGVYVCSGTWRGRLLESSRWYRRARRDRASGGTVGGCHASSVPPSEGGLRACGASQESS